MSDPKIPNFPELMEALRGAREDYDTRALRAQEADRAKSSAHERLNQAQIALNNAMAQLKADAPWDTTWHNEKRKERPNV